MISNNAKSWIKDIVLALLSALIAAINLNTFVHSGGLTPSGFSGLSLLIVRIADSSFHISLNYSVLYILFNIPGVILAYKALSKRFTLLSLIDVIMTSVLVAVLPKIQITNDLLLISVFGGILGGLSAAAVLEAGACGGGTDFISIFFAKKYRKAMWNYMLVLNAIMLLATGFLFGWNIALYSIIFQYVNTQVVNFFDTRYKRSCFFIITDKPEEITSEVVKQLHHSVTELSGIGGYSHQQKMMLYTVCGDYEVNRLTKIIMETDPKAFVNVIKSTRITGNFNQRPF